MMDRRDLFLGLVATSVTAMTGGQVSARTLLSGGLTSGDHGKSRVFNLTDNDLIPYINRDAFYVISIRAYNLAPLAPQETYEVTLERMKHFAVVRAKIRNRDGKLRTATPNGETVEITIKQSPIDPSFKYPTHQPFEVMTA